MPKKEKRPPTPPSSSEGEEDYDSESYSGGQNELPEITNKEHLLNYESDSSDQGGSDGKESSMDLAIGLKR